MTFTYTKRPPADCKCSDMPTPRLSLKCLGLEQGGADMALDAAYQSRLEALYAWRSGFMAANTVMGAATGSPPEWIGPDMDLADGVVAAFADALGEIHETAAAAAEWDAAFTDMQADLYWLHGVTMTDAPAPVFSPYQGGPVGLVYQNNHVGRNYTLTAVRRNGVDVPHGPLFKEHDEANGGAPSEGWTNPYSAVWATDDTVFTITVTLAGVEWAYDYVLGVAEIGATVRQNLPPPMQDDAEARAAWVAERLAQLLRRYTARMDYCRTLAGIVPKSESSSSDAGSCWTDHGGTHWWVDAEGYYLPAFTNQAYVSARRDADTGKPYSTQEFGFGLVVACPERLREGDEITLRIEAVDGERPYRVGDEAIIQTIGAGPAWLAGGVDGTDVQTWRVLGSASGALPDCVVPTDGTPVPDYAAAGVTLRLAPGGIPFSLGDSFSLAVEAGQFQWRRTDGGVPGAWSAEADIPAAGVAPLADGLTVHFDAGAAPSFVPDDDYLFRVHQPWAASHVRDAQASRWGWAGAGATLVLDLGAVQPLGALALARYALPAGAVLAFELSDDGAAWTAPVALDASGPACVHLLDAAARHVRLTVAGAEGGHIGWLWLGVPLATDHHASSCQRRRRWAARRGDGPNAASLYSGVGDGWSLAWAPGDEQGSRLLAADVVQLVALLDWAQVHDEPLLFVPHHQHPQDAALVRFAADALEVTDLHAWQPDSAGDRILSAALELDPVYA